MTVNPGISKVFRRLRRADRAHQRELGGSLLLRCIKWGLLGVLGCFALDVFLHLNSVQRHWAVLGLMGIGLLLLSCSAYVAYVRKSRLEHIARLLEERDPALGSKLINLLQLHGTTTDAALPPLTQAMTGLAVEGYVDQLAQTHFERTARTRALRREMKRAGLGILLFALLLVAFLPVTRTEVPRFLNPYGDHPPYSLTRLEIETPGPDGTNVIYGRNFIVQVNATGHRPKEVFLTAHPPNQPEKAITLAMFDKGEVGYRQEINDIRTELVLQAHTKDRHSLSKQAHIGLIMVPQLDRAFLQVEPPAYTGIKPQEKPFSFNGVQALAGSLVRFRLQSNRPLRAGSIQVISGGGEPEVAVLERTAEREVAGAFTARDSGRVRLGLVDVDGIASQESWECALTVTHDLGPDISIHEPEKDSFVAMDFLVQPYIQANDDYGLKSVRIHRALNGVFSPTKEIAYEGIVRSAREALDFNFRQLGVQPGDIVSFFAEAIDTAPEPHLARSQTIHLMVISVEEYNDYLRERLDITMLEEKYGELMALLNDLIEQQKKLGEAAAKKAAEAEKAEGAQKETLTRELDRLLAEQNQVNQQLLKQAERMETSVRENPLYDVELEVQEELREQAGEIRESVKLNEADTSRIAQNSNPENGQRQVSAGSFNDLAQASDEQVKRLGGVEEEARQQVAETLQDLSAMQELIRDFNQFEALYRTQQALAEQAKAYDRAGQLSREDQLALKSLAAMEKEVGDILGELADKLRADAQTAEENFPKAAQSARDLADKIEDARLRPLARQATDKMLAAKGDESYQMAERLRGEMEKLFGECCNNPGNRPQAGELDQYLRLQRGMKAGKTFAQMLRTRNFNRPGGKNRGQGMMGAAGEGQAGESGYSISTQEALELLGNESMINRSASADRFSSKTGYANPKTKDDSASPATDQTESLKGLNPVNRQSGAIQSESIIEKYNEVVEKYFKAITKEAKKSP